MTDKKLSSAWLKGAVTGSLWASSEIILGSFLHNLKIPFSGTILSGIGVLILVASHRVFREKGMIWRAAVICAFAKTLSPSPNILGPMISIAAEGFILEAVVRLSGANIISYMIGGGLAVTWSLFYKVINIMIIYGFNIIELYKELYKYALKQLNIHLGDPSLLIYFLTGIYFISGVIAAIVGYLAADTKQDATNGDASELMDDELEELSNALAQNADASKLTLQSGEQSLNLQSGYASVTPTKAYMAVKDNMSSYFSHTLPAPGSVHSGFSLSLLYMHLALLLTAIALFNVPPLRVTAIFIFTYLAFNIFRYKDNLKRIKKVKFWINLFLFITISAFLLNAVKDPSHLFNMNVVTAAVEMSLRALFFVFGFSAINIEFRNPVITAWFRRKGMGQFSIAVEASFAILPFMIGTLNEERQIFRTPFKAAAHIISKTSYWLKRIEDHLAENEFKNSADSTIPGDAIP